MFSYLLAFIQLTWQVENGSFLSVFDNFFKEFISIGPEYIRGEWEGCRGGVSSGKA